MPNSSLDGDADTLRANIQRQNHPSHTLPSHFAVMPVRHHGASGPLHRIGWSRPYQGHCTVEACAHASAIRALCATAIVPRRGATRLRAYPEVLVRRQAEVCAQSEYGRLVKRTYSALAMGCSPDDRYGQRRRG